MQLTGIPLQGEGFDQAFETSSGNRFRARVVQKDAHAPFAHAAPTGITLQITVALLDTGNTVQRLGGAWRIFDPMEVSIDGAGMADIALDIESAVMRAIEQRCAAAEAVIANQATVHTYLAGWGLGHQNAPTALLNQGE